MTETKREPRVVLDEVRALLAQAGLGMVGTLFVLDGPIPERCECCKGNGIIKGDAVDRG